MCQSHHLVNAHEIKPVRLIQSLCAVCGSNLAGLTLPYIVLPCVAAVVSGPAWRMLVLLIARYVSNLINERTLLSFCLFLFRSIVISVSVCLSVCLFVCLSVLSHISKPHVQMSPSFLYVLPMVVDLSSFDCSAIRYVLPVLWMTSCFHTMERMGRIRDNCRF